MEIAVLPKNDDGAIIHFHKMNYRKVKKLKKNGELIIDNLEIT